MCTRCVLYTVKRRKLEHPLRRKMCSNNRCVRTYRCHLKNSA